MRLATILLYLTNRVTIPKTKVETTPSVKHDTLLLNTSHTIACSKNRYACTVCQSNFHRTDSGFKTWLQTECIPVGTPTHPDQPRPLLEDDALHIGNNVTHSSHTLYLYRGVIYCNKCGARSGTNQIRYLAKPCEPHVTGQAVIDRINAGKLPKGLTHWPA